MANNVMLVQELDDGAWVAQLSDALPALDVRAFGDGDDDELDPASVTHVVMWRVSPTRLASFTNLEAILVMGAGHDHLDLARLPDVPVVRLVDPAMADDIALYVLSWVIHFQRDFDRYRRMQGEPTWRGELSPVFARDYTVGVFGAGEIGTAVMRTCALHGFRTLGWSRSRHDRTAEQFFADCDVVVDLVPLSDATRGVIGAVELAALGNGVLINVGRGATVDTDALLAALDGELRGAVLDVFETEPLPTDSPLWSHDKVIVTPHVAGRSDAVTASTVIAASVADLRAGSMPAGVINR